VQCSAVVLLGFTVVKMFNNKAFKILNA